MSMIGDNGPIFYSVGKRPLKATSPVRIRVGLPAGSRF